MTTKIFMQVSYFHEIGSCPFSYLFWAQDLFSCWPVIGSMGRIHPSTLDRLRYPFKLSHCLFRSDAAGAPKSSKKGGLANPSLNT